MTESSTSGLLHSKWRDAAALALVAALTLFFFWRIITPRLEDRAIFPPGDFSDQFWAFRMYEAREFAQGRLPLWSPNYNSGHPFVADVQSAVFYPVSLAWTLAVVAARGGSFTLVALEIEAIFHFILAGAFTYLFARRMIGSRVGALVSAVTFAFGGYLTSYPPQQLAILETAAWLPLALLLLDVAVERGARYYIAAGLVIGVSALAGHPQTFLFVLYACFVFFVWRVWNAVRTGKGNSGNSGELKSRVDASVRQFASDFAPYLVRFALSIALAAGIAAAQWVPTLEYQTVSTRAAIGWTESSGGFPNIDPLQMILPGFTSAFQSPLYLGVLPLWLAILALVVNRTREKTFWALLALGSLLVAFGAYAFAYALLYLFAPGFALFRDQERLAFVVSFALALLAGYGFRDLIESGINLKPTRRAWALLPAGVTATGLMALMLFVAGAQHASGRLAFLANRAGLMVLLFVLATALVAWRLRSSQRWSVGAFTALSIAFIAFDLFTVDNPAYNAQPIERYPETPIVQTIQSDHDVFRVVDEGQMPGHFGIPYRLEEIGGISPLRVARYDALLDALPPEKLWPLLNVRYVVTGRPGFANADVVKTDGATRLLRLKNPLPRAWFAASAQSADDVAVLDAMTSDAFDPRAIAYVAGPLSFAPNANSGQGTATFQELDPEHLLITVNTPVDALLVTSEVYYPGWSATIDGLPVPVLRADYAFRAVPVRAGAHRVEMVFDPWSVKIGMGVTAISLVVALMGWLVVLRTNKSIDDVGQI